MPRALRETDLHVGGRIRLRRKQLGLSMQALAESVNVTFQQIQKYEIGHNRIGSSQLSRLARTLNVPVQYFFEGLPGEKAFETDEDAAAIGRFLTSKEGLRLVLAFQRISERLVRRSVVDLVVHVAAEYDGLPTGRKFAQTTPPPSRSRKNGHR